MNAKQEVTKQLNMMLKTNDLKPNEKMFKQYPQAMMFLGLAPSNYYKEVNKVELGKNINVPRGVYPIECGQGLNGVKADRLSGARLDDLATGVLDYQLDDLDPQDVVDVIEGNDDHMAGSTNSAWTNKYDYLY